MFVPRPLLCLAFADIYSISVTLSGIQVVDVVLTLGAVGEKAFECEFDGSEG